VIKPIKKEARDLTSSVGCPSRDQVEFYSAALPLSVRSCLDGLMRFFVKFALFQLKGDTIFGETQHTHTGNTEEEQYSRPQKDAQ
jgi:hypothetical protein